MALVLNGIRFDHALCYFDDLIVMALDLRTLNERLRTVFSRIESAGIKFKVSKCKMFQKSITFLSFRVSGEGVQPDPERVKAITEWPTPTNLTETRGFVGVCQYYRRHILDFAGIAKPLYEKIIFNHQDSIHFVPARKEYRMLRGDTVIQ